MNQKTKKHFGFPNYFKKIGLILVAIPFFILLLKMLSFEIPIKKEIIKMVFFDFIIVGLCIIILSRDKIEDEMTIQMRLIAFTGSFFGAVAMLITINIIGLLFDGIPGDISGQQLVFFMCFIYMFNQYWNKWKTKREEKRIAKAA